MKTFGQIYLKKTRNHNSSINKDELFSSSNNKNGLTDSTLNENYKKFALKQVNMQLDSKMLALIAKLNEDKIYENLKSQFDEEKKIILDKTLKKLRHSNSDYIINKHLNLQNFKSQLDNNFTYDVSENLFMHSFFDKIKTRKKRIIKKKKNYYIDVLYQGSSSPKKNKFKIKKQKPKFDYKLLLKSSSDLEEYFKNKEHNFGIKKINIKNQFFSEDNNKENTNELNKLNSYNSNKQKTIEYYSKLTKFNLIRNTKKRSLSNKIGLNQNSLSIIDEENKNAKNINFPNIKDKKNDKINENNNNISYSFGKSSKNIKNNNTMILTNDKNSIKMELTKNNIIKISFLNKEKEKEQKKEEEKEKEKQNQTLNLPKKIMSKTINANFLKDKINTIKFRLNENERIQYMNRIQKHKFKKVITDFNEKEKKIEKKYSKINKLIINLKNNNKAKDKEINNNQKIQNQKLIDSKNENPNSKTSRLKNIRMFKEWNEATSLYHFPLINKIIYKSNLNLDGIDKIKSNLKEEYINKLKKNKPEYIRKIDGKRIMQKLNDKFEIEKLKEMAIDLREKQRKREQFEVIEL